MSDLSNDPDEPTAAAIAGEVLDGPVRITRFPTGLQHFVFEAASKQGDAVVVRLSRQDDVGVARDSLYWSELLRPLGVPLPKVLHADTTMKRHRFPFVVLERLPGRDLGSVVDRLSREDQQDLARRLVSIQETVTSLPQARGYGFAPRLEGPFPHASWTDVVASSLRHSRRRIRHAGIVGDGHVDRVEAALHDFSDYFESIGPTPFLHDITTKNVIVDGSRLSGIVDVDELCFGDPLFLVGLIRMALLANGHAADYADAWVHALSCDREQRRALDVYTALFAVSFMAELGYRYNRSRPEPVDEDYIERLAGLLDHYLTYPS